MITISNNKQTIKAGAAFIVVFCIMFLIGTGLAHSESASTGDDAEKLKSEIETLKHDRDNLVDTVGKTRSANRQYSQEIEKLNSQVTELEKKLAGSQNQFGSMDASIKVADAVNVPAPSTGNIVDREEKTLDLLYKIDAYAEKDEKLGMDAARAHYNMGNIYFQRGEYEIAAREYYQAVTLMPDDPDAHYNLAFVSGEYLHDYKTALKHYKMYLYLNPNSKDKPFVDGKVTDAELQLRSMVDSPLEKQHP
ncbi:MAG: tetratricopeptide repeat protein [Candidatus Omnitrophica bacterium]|nr:tetratricopeptide repeat protein [Candidatus Omnitrophota bacterium]